MGGVIGIGDEEFGSCKRRGVEEERQEGEEENYSPIILSRPNQTSKKNNHNKN